MIMLRYWACRIPGVGSRECHVGEEAGGVRSLKVGAFQNYLFLHKHLNSRINRVHGFTEQQTMSSRRAQEPTAWVGRASVHHPDAGPLAIGLVTFGGFGALGVDVITVRHQ